MKKDKIILVIVLLIVIGLPLSCSIPNNKEQKHFSNNNSNSNTTSNQQDWYKAGLSQYDVGNYEQAKVHFRNVKETDSNYISAQNYIEQCDEKIKEREGDKKEREKEAQIEEKKFLTSKAGKIYKFCQSKHALVTKEDCIDAANGKIWIGMNIWLLVAKRGKPNSINPSNYGNGNEYQYCWFNWTPMCFYTKSDDKVYAYN